VCPVSFKILNFILFTFLLFIRLKTVPLGGDSPLAGDYLKPPLVP
jgi:hypothetical protein